VSAHGLKVEERRKQVAELIETSKEKDYIIRGRLADKEKELEEIRAQQAILQANMANILKFLSGMEKKETKIHAWDEAEGPMQTAKALLEEKEKEVRKRGQHGVVGTLTIKEDSIICPFSNPINFSTKLG